MTMIHDHDRGCALVTIVDLTTHGGYTFDDGFERWDEVTHSTCWTIPDAVIQGNRMLHLRYQVRC
jgi:hypothetical protein